EPGAPPRREASASGRFGGSLPLRDRAAGTGILNFLVTQGPEDFEHLAPGGEHPAAPAFVLVHRQHEFLLRLPLFPFPRGRLPEPPPATELSGVGRSGGLLRGPAIDPSSVLSRAIFPFHGFFDLCRGLSHGHHPPQSSPARSDTRLIRPAQPGSRCLAPI